MIRSDLAEHLQPAHPRHHGVHQQNIVRRFPEFMEPHGPIFRRFYVMPFGSEDALAAFSDPQFIVNDKDAQAALPGLWWIRFASSTLCTTQMQNLEILLIKTFLNIISPAPSLERRGT
jgi:hypothetical protein